MRVKKEFIDVEKKEKAELRPFNSILFLRELADILTI